MRILTNATEEQVREAARTAGVGFERFEVHGSRTHDHGYDVILTGSSTRRANGGWTGSTITQGYAATWDEWGVFLDAIFRVDPNTDAGGYYVGYGDFREQTGCRYDGPFTPCKNHKWSWSRGDAECAKGCGAVRYYARRVG